MLWRPHPGFQMRFLAHSAREVLGGGAAGPGKTDCLIYGALRYISEPWCRVLFLRQTYPDLQQVIDRTMRVFPALGATWRAQERRWVFPSGATYRFAAAERLPDLISDHQGSEYTEIAWDELGLIADPQMWSWLKTRCRSDDPRAVIRQRASANPGGPGNAWLRARFVDLCGKDGGEYLDPTTGYRIAFVPGRLSDNPTIDSATQTDYRKELEGQPEMVRRALLDGDWEVGEGLAFPELHPDLHFASDVVPQPYWTQWGSFDWGYQHWAVFCWFLRDERGRTYLRDTIWMRRLHPDQQAETIWENVPVDRLRTVYAGTDCWDVQTARGLIGPTIADVFTGKGFSLLRADTARQRGFSVLRDLLSWRGRGPNGEDIEPRLVFFDTPGNRQLFNQLRGLVLDPKKPEDVLKVNADATTGEGGDDGFDCLRYGIASHEMPAKTPVLPISAFDPATLSYEYERTHRPGSKIPKRPKKEDASWW